MVPAPPAANFAHATQNVTVTVSNPDEFPSVRILGLMAANPTTPVSILAAGTAGRSMIRINAATFRDNQVYVLVVHTTSESGSVMLDTRPAG